MKRTTLRAVAAIFAALALPASAKTYYVDAATGNDSNTGLKADQAFATIQTAIDKAAAGSTILVAPGTYAPFRTSKKLAIKSTDGAEATIIDGSLGEKYVAPAVVPPEYVHASYKWRYDETLDNWVETDEVDYYYYYAHANGDPIYGDDPSQEDDAEYHRWYPPVDENIWTTPPKAKTVKTKWSRYTERTGDVRCTETCALMGRMTYTVETEVNGSYQQCFKNVSSVSTSLSGFTLRGSTFGIVGGTASYCVVTDIDGVPVGYSTLTDSEVRNNDARSFCGTTGFGTIAAAATLNRCEIHDNTFRIGAFGNAGFADAFAVDNNWRGSVLKRSALHNCALYRNTGVNAEAHSHFAALVESDVYNCTIADNTLPDKVAAVRGNVFNSIVWGNVDGAGNPANVRTVVDEKTGQTVAGDFMNYTTEEIVGWNEVGDGEDYFIEPVYGSVERKALCSMVNSLTDCPIEQKGNGKGWVTSGGGLYGSAGSVWKYRVTYKNSTGNISADPLFIDPENGDYRLAPNSPCVDAGADYTKTTGKFDLDSGARKVGKVDMGAYELQPQTAVPADYDGDGKTDAAFYFAASGQWWIFQSRDGLRTISLPDRNAVPCPGDYDGDPSGAAEPAYFTAAAKTPEFVRLSLHGVVRERTAFGAKGATPVAAKLNGAKATFGVYTANAKKPEFSFLGNPLSVTFGAKASRPVVADFDADGKDDLGVYIATASKPAFSILQSSQDYATAKLFLGGPVALGAKGAIPCCADFDKDGAADFATYMSNTKAPYFTRLPSSTKFRETWTLPMGSKGDVPVVGVYETEFGPASPAIWTGTAWTYLVSDYTDCDLLD